MHNPITGFTPQPPALPEVLLVSQVTRQFYHEAAHRQAFTSYCDWYQKTAAQNQRDLLVMRREFNLFRWLGRS